MTTLESIDENTAMAVKYTNKERKVLFEKINSLSSTEHEEIYRIVSEHSINVSKNKNGVFFNLSSVDDDIIAKIDAFVTYCVSNKEHLDEYDKRLNECKMSNKYGKLVNMNVKLEDLVQPENPLDNQKDDWAKVKLDTRGAAKISQLLDKMQEDRDKLHVKRVNSKFINAKKRFSKRIVSDKKFDFEHLTELEQEDYLIRT